MTTVEKDKKIVAHGKHSKNRSAAAFLVLVLLGALLAACAPAGGGPTTGGDTPGGQTTNTDQPGPNAIQSSWGYWEGGLGQVYISDKTVAIVSRVQNFGVPSYTATYTITAASEATITGALSAATGIASSTYGNIETITMTPLGGSAYRAVFPNDYTLPNDTLTKATGRNSTFTGIIGEKSPTASTRSAGGSRALGLTGIGGMKMIARNLKNSRDTRVVVTETAAEGTEGAFDASVTETGAEAPTIPGDKYEISFPEQPEEPPVIVTTVNENQDVGQLYRPTSAAFAVATTVTTSNNSSGLNNLIFFGKTSISSIIFTNTGKADSPMLFIMFYPESADFEFRPYTIDGNNYSTPLPSVASGGIDHPYAENVTIAKGGQYVLGASLKATTMNDSAGYHDYKVNVGFFDSDAILGGTPIADTLLWVETLVFRVYKDSFVLFYSDSPANQTGRTAGGISTPDGRWIPLPSARDSQTYEIPLPRYGKSYISVVNGQYRFAVDTYMWVDTATNMIESTEIHDSRENATTLAFGDRYLGHADPNAAPDFLVIDPTASPHTGAGHAYDIEFYGVYQNEYREYNKTTGTYASPAVYSVLYRGMTSNCALMFRSYMGYAAGNVRLEALDPEVSIYTGTFGTHFSTGIPYVFMFYDNLKFWITVPGIFTGDVHLRLHYQVSESARYLDFALPTAEIVYN